MRLFPLVPHHVQPARAVGAVCAVPLLLAALALASRSPRFFAQSSESLRVRDPGCPARPKNRLYNQPTTLYRTGPDTQCLGCLPTDQSRVAQPALMTPDSLSAFARSAPPLVACLSFGCVDADLPVSRCRRCRRNAQVTGRR